MKFEVQTLDILKRRYDLNKSCQCDKIVIYEYVPAEDNDPRKTIEYHLNDVSGHKPAVLHK